MDSSSKRSLESNKTVTDFTFGTIFTEDFPEELVSDLLPDNNMVNENQTMKSVQNVRHESKNTIFPLMQEATTVHEINVAYDDFMENLCNDIDNDIDQLKGNTFFKDLLQPDKLIQLDDMSSEEIEYQELAQSITKETFSITPQLPSNSITHQFQSQSFQVHPYNAVVDVGATASTRASDSALVTASSGASIYASFSYGVAKPVVSASIGNSIMFSNTVGNSLTHFQSRSSPSFPLLPHISSSSHQQVPRYFPYQIPGISPQGIPATTPLAQYNQSLFWFGPPPFTDFPNFVHAWEGSLVGKIRSYREFHNKARVVRKPTSLVTLTNQWWKLMKITLFIPTKDVNYTMKMFGGPIDYVFFHIVKGSNLHLYDHMMSNNLCAKIELLSQTIILSTTQSRHHYLGAIFPGDIIFVEPA